MISLHRRAGAPRRACVVRSRYHRPIVEVERERVGDVDEFPAEKRVKNGAYMRRKRQIPFFFAHHCLQPVSQPLMVDDVLVWLRVDAILATSFGHQIRSIAGKEKGLRTRFVRWLAIAFARPRNPEDKEYINEQ